MKKLLMTSALMAGLATCQQANAALTISGSVGGAPTGVKMVNFDTLPTGAGGGTATGPNGSVGVTFTPDGQAVTGSSSGAYAAPFLSGGNGTGFGNANGADTTTYLTTGKGAVTLTFGAAQMYFGILWGSVDSYNTLEFYNGSTLVGTVTGSQVVASPNGDQGVLGTLYVNINSTLAFNKVIAKSSEYAFEFDNVAYNETPVPEPSTYLAGALLLLPFAASTMRRLRKS